MILSVSFLNPYTGIFNVQCNISTTLRQVYTRGDHIHAPQ